MNARQLYQSLLAAYGPQGWWPLLGYQGGNPTASGCLTGYHPGQYGFPRTATERFEICVGAILTQNTAWGNVEIALAALQEEGLLAPRPMLKATPDKLASLIRPSGYFNLKTRKLQEFCRFYSSLAGRVPERAELLRVWGVGPETADSILLYAYGRLEMVVDAYTRRVLARLGLLEEAAPLAQVKRFCQSGLPSEVPVYQEFHALMVEHGKRISRSVRKKKQEQCSNTDFIHL